VTRYGIEKIIWRTGVFSVFLLLYLFSFLGLKSVILYQFLNYSICEF
jgi:hypothetical protein